MGSFSYAGTCFYTYSELPLPSIFITVKALRTLIRYVIYLPFALRVAIGTGAAAVSLPVACRHFYADFPSNIRKFQFTVTLHHEIKRLRKQKQMPANYPFKDSWK